MQNRKNKRTKRQKCFGYDIPAKKNTKGRLFCHIYEVPFVYRTFHNKILILKNLSICCGEEKSCFRKG